MPTLPRARRQRRSPAFGPRSAAVALALAAAAVAATPSGASAEPTDTAVPSDSGADLRPCYGPRWSTMVADERAWEVHVRLCPTWAPENSIPVHALPSPESRVVGTVNAMGDVWFHCQDAGVSTALGRAQSTWWASTETRDGHRGWVSQVYFRGAEDGAPDGGLEYCRDQPGRDGRAGQPAVTRPQPLDMPEWNTGPG